MDLTTLNWIAVITAAFSNFLIGGFWYSPFLFGKIWMKENGFTDDDLKKANMAKVFILTFLFSFVMALNLGIFLNNSGTTVTWGLISGFLAGFGWAAMSIFVIGLFERKSAKYLLIHGGYVTVSFVVMGFIISIWR